MGTSPSAYATSRPTKRPRQTRSPERRDSVIALPWHRSHVAPPYTLASGPFRKWPIAHVALTIDLMMMTLTEVTPSRTDLTIMLHIIVAEVHLLPAEAS